MRAALLIAMFFPALAAADVIYHAFPRGHGVSKKLRGEIGRAVRAHVGAAGHRLGPKRRATYLLATRIARDGEKYVVVVRFRPKKEKKVQQFTGTAGPDEIIAVLAEQLEQVLPTRRVEARREAPPEMPAPSPVAAPPRIPEPKVHSTWVEDQSKWPNIYKPGPALAPFPDATNPPPKIGEIPK